MRRRRRWLVHALIAVIAAGHLYDIATGREHWPFSPYPMYSHLLREWTLTTPRLYGVRRDGGGELPLWATVYLEPFDQARLLQAVQAMWPERDGRARVASALADCLARYERRRASGEHDGPPLAGLRYYYLHWTLDAAARNVDRPDHRELVAEVAATENAP